MFKKLIFWLSCFVISYLAQWIGLMPQGKAFFLIGLLLTILSVISTIYSYWPLFKPKALIITAVLAYLISILIAWLISKLFKLDFYTVYQILTLIGCILNRNNKK